MKSFGTLYSALYTGQRPQQTGRHTRLSNSPSAHYAVSQYVRAV